MREIQVIAPAEPWLHWVPVALSARPAHHVSPLPPLLPAVLELTLGGWGAQKPPNQLEKSSSSCSIGLSSPSQRLSSDE